jgi:hypothetical protein
MHFPLTYACHMPRPFHAPLFHTLKFSKSTKHEGLRPCSSKSTTVIGPTSSHTRQRTPLYQVQSRVTRDSTLLFPRSKVESHSTARHFVPGPKSSHTRQHATLCQVQSRVTLDSTLLCARSKIEHKSIHQFVMSYSGFP